MLFAKHSNRAHTWNKHPPTKNNPQVVFAMNIGSLLSIKWVEAFVRKLKFSIILLLSLVFHLKFSWKNCTAPLTHSFHVSVIYLIMCTQKVANRSLSWKFSKIYSRAHNTTIQPYRPWMRWSTVFPLYWQTCDDWYCCVLKDDVLTF